MKLDNIRGILYLAAFPYDNGDPSSPRQDAIKLPPGFTGASRIVCTGAVYPSTDDKYLILTPEGDTRGDGHYSVSGGWLVPVGHWPPTRFKGGPDAVEIHLEKRCEAAAQTHDSL